jgi:hypothetical protein
MALESGHRSLKSQKGEPKTPWKIGLAYWLTNKRNLQENKVRGS